MPCNLYNNNGFGCGGCCHFVRTNAVTLTGNVLSLNIPNPTRAYSNKDKVCICIAQSIPEGVTSANTVSITLGSAGVAYPLRTKCGNNVHADQIRSRKVYHTNVASDTASFVVNACELCKTGFNFPTLPATTTTA